MQISLAHADKTVTTLCDSKAPAPLITFLRPTHLKAVFNDEMSAEKNAGITNLTRSHLCNSGLKCGTIIYG